MRWDKRANRLAPDAGPEHFRTFAARAPLASHWRPATCEEFECDDYLYGFAITVDMSTDLGQRQYEYLTHDRSRSIKSMERTAAPLIRFVYGPGFQGFGLAHKEHRVPIGRPPIYLVAEGDFRGNPRGIPARVHRTVENWVDDFATQLDYVAARRQRG